MHHVIVQVVSDYCKDTGASPVGDRLHQCCKHHTMLCKLSENLLFVSFDP